MKAGGFSPGHWVPGGTYEEDARVPSEAELALIDELLAEVGDRDRGALTGALVRVQELLGYVPAQVQEALARRLRIPAVMVQELVSFSADLSPSRGDGAVDVCVGAACLAPHGQRVVDAVVQAVAGNVRCFPCLGACWGAPAVGIASERLEHVTPIRARRWQGEAMATPGPRRSRLRGFKAARWGGEELAAIRTRLGERLEQRFGVAKGEGVRELLVCNGVACSRPAADRVAEVISRSLAERGLDRRMRVVRVGCGGDELGRVSVRACPSGWRVLGVDEGTAEAVVTALHLDPSCLPAPAVEIRAMRKAAPDLLRRCGVIDPCSLEEYVGSGGFAALERALVGGEGIVWAGRALRASGMRRRQEKRALLAEEMQNFAGAGDGTVVCLCSPGDSHLAVDALLLGGDPFAVIEGMVLAGLLCGVGRGILLPPAGSPHLMEQVELAVALARRCGLLGPAVLNTEFAFELEVVPAPRQLVAMNETALRRYLLAGQPLKPAPQAVARALPRALLIDPESAARIASVLELADRHSATAREVAGRRLVAVLGRGMRPAVLEVAGQRILGEELLADNGVLEEGAAPRVKGVLSGGSTGIFQGGTMAAQFDVTRGQLLVLDITTCVVALLGGLLEMLAREACGACAPGRSGVGALRGLVRQMAVGQASPGILASARDIAAHLRATAKCELCQAAGELVTSALEAFPAEIAAHLEDRRCPAGQCAPLVARFWIDPERCDGCGVCQEVCADRAVQGGPQKGFEISLEHCSRCGDCRCVCPSDAILWT